jgi:hypothetical protein
MNRLVIAVLVGAAGLLASDAAALAQGTTFAGGRLTSIERTNTYQPSVGITVQPRGNRIALRFTTTLLCGRTRHEVGGGGEIDWDGSIYAAEGVGRIELGGGDVRYAWQVTGTVSGQASDGILRIAGREKVGRRTRRCTSRPVRAFQTRAQYEPIGAGTGPELGGLYVGTTDQTITDDLPGPVVMRVSPDGRRIGAHWEAAAACGRGPREIFTNFTPSSAVRNGASFYRAERFEQSFSDALVRYQVRFSGAFKADGAFGTLQLRTSVYDRTGKKLRTRCDSGLHRWTAMRASFVPGSPPFPTR